MTPIPDLTPLAGGEAAALGLVGAQLNRIAGPPSKELGDALARWTRLRLANLGRIGDKAERKIEAVGAEGEVPPRVLARVIEDGSLTEDDVTHEYLAGVLAASKTPDAADDRGAFWAGLISTLSSYQLRTHYLIYRQLRESYVGVGKALSYADDRRSARVLLRLDEYAEAMNLTADVLHAVDIASHALQGLQTTGLIAIEYGISTNQVLRHPAATELSDLEYAIDAEPSLSGIELFLWAHGHHSRDPQLMFDTALNPFDLGEPIPACPKSSVM